MHTVVPIIGKNTCYRMRVEVRDRGGGSHRGRKWQGWGWCLGHQRRGCTSQRQGPAPSLLVRTLRPRPILSLSLVDRTLSLHVRGGMRRGKQQLLQRYLSELLRLAQGEIRAVRLRVRLEVVVMLPLLLLLLLPRLASRQQGRIRGRRPRRLLSHARAPSVLLPV